MGEVEESLQGLNAKTVCYACSNDFLHVSRKIIQLKLRCLLQLHRDIMQWGFQEYLDSLLEIITKGTAFGRKG